MNYEATAFDWNHARAFLATAEEGSLSAAARHLHQSQPTLSRQVAALESELGVTLFERVGKRLVLTETGAELLQHVRAMAEAAGTFSLGASGLSQSIAGEVRISVGEVVAAYLLPPVLKSIRACVPEVQIHLVVSNRMSDLLRREADIAIRHVRPEQSDLVARKVRDSSAHIYAAKSWIEVHGRPRNNEDIARAEFIGADDNPRFVELLGQIGLPVAIEQFKWSTDSHVVGWEMVRRGLGVGAMVKEVGDVTPEVSVLLPQVAPLPVPFWLVTHRELHTSRRIRVVFDLLADALTCLP